LGLLYCRALLGAKGGKLRYWVVSGFLFTPLTALVLGTFAPARPGYVEHRDLTEGPGKTCPSCAEVIKAEAKVLLIVVTRH